VVRSLHAGAPEGHLHAGAPMSLTPSHVRAPEGHLTVVAVEGRLHAEAPEGRLHTGASTSLTPPHVKAPEGHLVAIDEEEHAVKVTQEEAVEVAGEGGLGVGDQGRGAARGEALQVEVERQNVSRQMEKLKVEKLSKAVVDNMSSESRGGWEREPRR
jgi:hypothetical protein